MLRQKLDELVRKYAENIIDLLKDADSIGELKDYYDDIEEQLQDFEYEANEIRKGGFKNL